MPRLVTWKGKATQTVHYKYLLYKYLTTKIPLLSCQSWGRTSSFFCLLILKYVVVWQQPSLPPPSPWDNSLWFPDHSVFLPVLLSHITNPASSHRNKLKEPWAQRRNIHGGWVNLYHCTLSKTIPLKRFYKSKSQLDSNEKPKTLWRHACHSWQHFRLKSSYDDKLT